MGDKHLKDVTGQRRRKDKMAATHDPDDPEFRPGPGPTVSSADNPTVP